MFVKISDNLILNKSSITSIKLVTRNWTAKDSTYQVMLKYGDNMTELLNEFDDFDKAKNYFSDLYDLLIGDDEMFNINLKKLKELALKQNMPLSEIAERAGVSKFALYKIFGGETKIIQPKTVSKLANFFKVEPDELILKE